MKYAIPLEPVYKTLEEMTDEEFELVLERSKRPNGSFTTSSCLPHDIFMELRRREGGERDE